MKAAERDRKTFLDELWEQKPAGIATRGELEVLWQMFCTHMVNHLQSERPVDCYLFKLHLSPYRVDWKEKLAERFPELPQILREASGPERQQIAYSETREDFMSIDLMAMNAGTIVRSLEIECSESWYKQITEAEFKRRHLVGYKQYEKSILGSLQRFLQTAARLLAQWQLNAHRPSGADCKGTLHGAFRVLGGIRAARALSGIRGDHPPRKTFTRDPSKPTLRDYPKNFPLEDEPLPQMPPVQQTPQNLRDCRPDLPAQGPDPAPGLLVLPPAQEPPPV